MARQASPQGEWTSRVDELWEHADELDEQAFVDAMDRLASELPPDDPRALFERAGARDSIGQEELAIPLYQQALQAGLTGSDRRRAIIQLASSLRNVGQLAESLRLLAAEQDRGSDELDDAVAAFLALVLVDSGRSREAVSVALRALAPHLPRYQRSVANYARLLIEPDEGS